MASESSQLLNTLTVIKLKTILRDAKLPVSGLKSVLISRVLENIEHPSIRTFFDTYSPTSTPTPTPILTNNNDKNDQNSSIDPSPINKTSNEDRLEAMNKILEDVSVAHKHVIRILIDNKSDSISLRGILDPIENGDLKLFYKAFLLNTSVRKLFISNQYISMYMMKTIKKILLSNRLTDLTINSSPMDHHVGYMVPLNEGIKHTTSLINLKLAMLLDDENLSILKDSIISNTSIKSLDLKSNRIKCENIDTICDILKHNHTLQVLNLSDNDMSSPRSFVTNTNPNLLLDAFRANNTLKELKLSGNRLNFFSLRSLLRGIEESNINALDISYNDMITETWGYLNNVCANNNNIQRLILAGNKVATQEFLVLCNTIITHKNILELNIQHCIFDFVPSNIIARLITANFIEKLDISYLRLINNRDQLLFREPVYVAVRFGDDMRLIIDALEGNTTLRELYIRGMITTTYISSFLKVVRDIPMLSVLDISSNEIGKYGYLVADILMDNKLNELRILYTRLSDESISAIIDGVESTTNLILLIADPVGGKFDKSMERVYINRENYKHRYRNLLGILMDEF